MLRVDIGLLWTAINLVVLYVLMQRFLFKPVHKILEQRQAQVDQSLADAEEAKAQALKLEQEHSASLTKVEEEKRRILQDAQQQANQEYARIVADANTTAQGIIQNAETQAEARKKDILQKAQGEITEIVVAAAAKVAYANAEHDSDLYDEFLKKAAEDDG
ncbi:MAG: ATP synthase F0 subunit B [Clostridiales bacterium]|nr:ATP synthase F0 subunit B [Clostridiales bacterium]